jgi:hypothetical protein
MGDKPKPRQFCGGGEGGKGCALWLQFACYVFNAPKGRGKKATAKIKSRLRRGTADEIDASAPKKLEDGCSDAFDFGHALQPHPFGA